MKSPIYDVILGNIPGEKCPRVAQQHETVAVETSSKKGHNIRSLLAPTAVDTGITVDTIRGKQKDDVSLEDCRKRAETGEMKHTGRHNKSCYGYERASEKGNRYILTVVDNCTRYPEAVPLKSIETVTEALVDILCRIGIPKEMLSDRGTQFTSDLMEEVRRLLSVKRLTTSPYHPQCNGLVERFNAMLKGILKRLASDRPKDWDRYINAALFAYREAPQESLGFSHFELLYARPVRDSMAILRELWTEDITDEDVKTTYQYVIDLCEKVEKVIKVAHDNL
ncbi:cathepsin d [Plakobranchus ocellatus]|uniref:Cathepsin d n=1 Tax=Plakobranchus ocellatus TaxID=259542 RepID=A0AAV4AAQ3_9GAST|nr:cathepsin d [Plakobranchus ocellatus]